MARSFEWTNWTPSFPLTRERTVWLAAAAAKSAAALGPDVIEPYLRALAEGRHAYKVFDTLFGLTSIALAHDRVLTPIAKAITAAQDASVGRITAGAEQAPWMFRSALALLQRWEDEGLDMSRRPRWRMSRVSARSPTRGGTASELKVTPRSETLCSLSYLDLE